jgi:hypothetical protein
MATGGRRTAPCWGMVLRAGEPQGSRHGSHWFGDGGASAKLPWTSLVQPWRGLRQAAMDLTGSFLPTRKQIPNRHGFWGRELD